jgi:hypothetical protein
MKRILDEDSESDGTNSFIDSQQLSIGIEYGPKGLPISNFEPMRESTIQDITLK